jgi:LuxR family maltose regulon positive regulatory protein
MRDTPGFVNRIKAARMTGQEALPEAIGDLLRKNAFIRYIPDTGMYTIHRAVRDYLRNRFYRMKPESFQKQVLRQVGCCYAADAQLLEASRLFYAVKDFDAILSLPFDAQYVADQREKGMMAFILAVLGECPEATLLKYPFALLVFLYGMILSGRLEDSQKLSLMLGCAIEGNTAELSWEQMRRLKGEFTALMALTAHDDIRKMGKGAKAALDILGGPSIIWSKDMPWTFGNTSILCLFWREQGMLEETLQNMEESLPFQMKLTRGQGSGAASALRAEALIVRGEDDQAEIFCHRALYEARLGQQICVCLCAELTLVRIAILRGDMDGYWTALENIHSLGRENPQPYVLRMVELCMAAIGFMLHSTEHAAQWLCDLESIKNAVYAPAVPYVQVLHAHLLVSKRQYNQLCGICQPAIDMAKDMGYLYPQVFQLLFLAAAKHNAGDDGQARAHLVKALAMALPDRIYLPFAHYWNDLGGLLESIESPYDVFDGSCACGKARKTHAGAMPASVFYDRLNDLKALCRRQESGRSAIEKALLKSKSPLTPREREVALLAQNRLSNKEIASKLYISEKTIKTFLQSIYIKLDVHSKAELGERVF